MIGNEAIMKSYKRIKREYKPLNVEKEYENDNYLIQTLKRTSKCTYDKKFLDFENNIKDFLSFIYQETQLQDDPYVKKIKKENDTFKKEYHSISENFQKSTNDIFKEIIKKYNQRGYKLPNLTYEHNLFKINTLIEQNRDKLEFILREDNKNNAKNKENNENKEKSKNNKNKNKFKNKNGEIAMKTMAYLNKLHFLLSILLSKDENKSKKISKYSMPKFKINVKKNETIDELQKSIEKLNLLIKSDDIINIEQKKSDLLKRKSSFASLNNLKKFKLLKTRKSNDELLLLKANLINKLETETGVTGSTMGTKDKKSEPSNSNFLSLRNNSNKSNHSNKSANSQKEVKSPGNKKRQRDILYDTPFDYSNTKNTTSKNIIKIKLRKISTNIKNKEKEKENNQEKEKENNNLLNSNHKTDENDKLQLNMKTKYSNSLSNYNYNIAKNNTNNSRYLKTYTKNMPISLKKNFNNNYKKYPSHQIKTTENINPTFRQSYKNKETPKMRSAFFVKTQSLRKKNISRNNNLFLNNNKYDINSKIQKNLFNTQYKTQDEYLQTAYKRLKRGNYNNLEEFVRKYLREYKHYEEKEEDLVVSHYNYKNLKRNLYELNSKIEQNDIGKKTERLYFNNHLSKRIFPLLTSMKEKEMNINRLEKFISSGVNKYK